MKLDSPLYVLELARDFRLHPTPAEKLLWQRLRDRQLNGWKFYRQYPLYRYIADFYCERARLIVELDGEIHDSRRQMVYDQERDHFLAVCGIRTLRLNNEMVLSSVDNALTEIRLHCDITLSPRPESV